MATALAHAEVGPEALVLEIDNKEPLLLAPLTSVLDALSRDYRQANGRDLVVREIRRGSTIIELIDWVAKANELFEFAANLATLATGAAAGYVVLRSRRRLGARTVLALAELATSTGTETKIKYKGPKGERLFVHMTPAQAQAIQEHAAPPPVAVQTSLPGPVLMERTLEDFAKTAALRRLESRTAEQPIDESVDGLFVLIRELIRALRQTEKGRVAIERIKKRLLQQGFDEAAAVLDE